MQSDSLSILIFFVSEELEKQREKYYHLLNKTRGNSPPAGIAGLISL